MHSFTYWRLSGFYFFYFAFIGAFAPYWSLYLKSLDFSALQIGILMSLLPVTRIFAPAAWGWLADHTGKRLMIVRLAALAGLVTYCGVFAGTSFAWLFAVMLVMGFFWSASLPLVEATTLSHLQNSAAQYGRIRSWGSLGFIFAVTVVGYLLDHLAVTVLLWVILGFKLGIVIFSRQIPDAPLPPHAADAPLARQIFKRPAVLAFFAACFLMSVAHGPYYTFYSIYLVEHGYSKSAVGALWAVGVICEIGVFFIISKLVPRFGLRRILAFSFGCAVLRFLIIGWGVESVALIFFAQTLHAATFGAYHAAAVSLVHQLFRGQHEAKGQALYSSLSYGVGGTLGVLLAGLVWEPLGAGWTFSISAGAALLGLGFILRMKDEG